MFFGNLANHLVGDARACSQPGEVHLLHFSAVAHVVHQVKGVPFSANESHDHHPVALASNCSVIRFHYTVN